MYYHNNYRCLVFYNKRTLNLTIYITGNKKTEYKIFVQAFLIDGYHSCRNNFIISLKVSIMVSPPILAVSTSTLIYHTCPQSVSCTYL